MAKTKNPYKSGSHRPMLEGILTSIDELGSFTKFNRFPYPYTNFTVKTEKGSSKKQYEGTILPDSIGSEIQIFSGLGLAIYDKTLDRWYVEELASEFR